MKVIIFEKENVEEIMAHFIAYGYSDFIIYLRVDRKYYEMNGIKVTQFINFDVESNCDRLAKIKGSLNEPFFIVYSSKIVAFDIDNVVSFHKQTQGTVTLIELNRRLVGALSETEIFDYMENASSLEKEAFLKVGQEGELAIYN